MSFKWPLVRLGDLADITSSKRIKRADYVTSGVPFFRSKEVIERSKGNDISTELFISEEQFSKIRNKFGAPEAGDILLTSVGTLGVPYQVRDSDRFYFKDGNLTWLRKFADSVLPEYVLYWIQSPSAQQKLDEVSIGSTQRALTIVALKSIELPLPPKTVQARIVDIAMSLDQKLENNRDINQTLEQMAQAIFKSWFVDFEPVKAKIAALEAGGSEEDALLAAMQVISGTSLFDAGASAAGAGEQLARLQAEHPEQYAELRATAELFPSAMQDSELGEIPEGWIPPNFEDIATAKQGKYLSKDKMITASSDDWGVPVWGGNGILGYAEKSSYFDPIVLMTCRGSNCGLIRHTESASWVSNNAFACTPKVGSIWFLLIYFYASSFDDCISGSAQPQITYSALRTKKLSFPFQQKICGRYSEIIQPLFDQILHLRGEIMSLEDIRDALLPKLLSGQLSVSTAETDLTKVEKPANV